MRGVEQASEGAEGRTTRRRFLVAFLAAGILHLVVLTPAGYLLPEGGPAASRRAIDVALFEPLSEALAPLLYRPAEPIPEGQVVDAPPVPGASPEASPDARFLSERAQTVGREMRATIRIAGPHRVGSQVAGPGVRSSRRSGVFGPQGEGMGVGRAPAPPGSDAVAASPGAATTAPGIPLPAAGSDPGAAAANAAARTRPSSPFPDGARGDSPFPPGDWLAPGVEVLEDAVAGSGLDRLEGVENGDGTAVSTRPFAHAGFYRRVRDRVAQYWDVPGAFAHNDPSGAIYGYRDRETIVLVTLDCEGALVDTSLLEDSGARFLDEEAVDAIAQAAPFHNPPRELCDARRGIITFTFGFYVETDQGPSLRVRLGR